MEFTSSDIQFTVWFYLIFSGMVVFDTIQKKIQEDSFPGWLLFLKSILTPCLFGVLGLPVGKCLYTVLGSASKWVSVVLFVLAYGVAGFSSPPRDKKIPEFVYPVSIFVMRLFFAASVYIAWVTVTSSTYIALLTVR